MFTTAKRLDVGAIAVVANANTCITSTRRLKTYIFCLISTSLDLDVMFVISYYYYLTKTSSDHCLLKRPNI